MPLSDFIVALLYLFVTGEEVYHFHYIYPFSLFYFTLCPILFVLIRRNPVLSLALVHMDSTSCNSVSIWNVSYSHSIGSSNLFRSFSMNLFNWFL